MVGFDLTRPVSDADMATIVAAFEEHSLLLFRKSGLNDEQQVAFSHQYSDAAGGVMEMGIGNEWEDGGIRESVDAREPVWRDAGLQEHSPDPRLRAWEEGRGGAGVFVPHERRIQPLANENKSSAQNSRNPRRAVRVKGWQEMADGIPRNTGYGPGNALWHTDSSFKLRGSLASILKSIVVPESGGGQTEFASMRCAYADLRAEQKAQLEGLVGVHDFSFSNGLLIRKWASPGKTPGLPPARHYVVRHTPGGPTLYVGRHLSHIEGMQLSESRLLIAKLNRACVQDQYTYSHQWTPGDLVIYDNRCMLHRGRPYNPQENRANRRTTVGERFNELERDGHGIAVGAPAPLPTPEESWMLLSSTAVEEVERGDEWLYGGKRELWWEHE